MESSIFRLRAANVPRETQVRLSVVVLAVVLAFFAVGGWWGIDSSEPNSGYDGDAFIDYASTLDDTGKLPTPEETYEYASPPAYFIEVVYAQRLARHIAGGTGAVLPGSPSHLRHLLWILAIIGAAALLSFGRGWVSRSAGLLLVAFALIWALADVASLSGNGAWRMGQLIALFWGAALICVAWLLAREAWPAVPLLWALVALATAVLPIVIRMSVMFHPETQMAVLCLAAVVIFLRSRRHSWHASGAVFLGATLGAAALTRQSAVIVAVALGLAAVVLDGRRALSFAAVAAGAMLLVAGPWWAYQANRMGNPIQSNLVRPGKMLDHQPTSFYVSFPVRDLVEHPYREAFRNELLPRIHADIWSDWAGGIHGSWLAPPKHAAFFASTQSVLGFFVDALSLGGLIVLGWLGLRRTRARTETSADVVLAVSSIVALVTWAAFVAMLVRFPQFDGDPIKSTYMLFLGPLFVVGAVAAGRSLWQRWPWFRIAAVAWVVLYAASYAGHLATAFA